MSRYRLLPSPAQEAVLRDHCAHARFIWNLAIEQHSQWRPGRTSAPGYLEQCRQLTQARAEHPWLAAGSQMVQQQALRDFARAMAAFFDPQNPARRPSWRKAGRDEGFRIVGRPGRQWDVRRVSRHVGQVRVPKAGWVRFRWSRAVPPGAKSYRITLDRAGRWHLAFTVIPEPISIPGNGKTVGIDRGVAVSAALSTGEMLTAPGLRCGTQEAAEAPSAQARPRPAGVEPARQGQAGRGPTARPRSRCPERLGREGLHASGTPVRRNQGREPGRQEHDPLGQGNRRDARPECPAEGRAQPGHPRLGLGSAGAPTGRQGPRPCGEDHPRVHQPALLGVRARGSGVA